MADPSNDDTAKIMTDSDAAKRSKQEKLAKQLRDNLAKRKGQSRARNTKPRKFTKKSD